MKPLLPLTALLGSLIGAAPAYPDDTAMTKNSDCSEIELRSEAAQ